jgi:hypothetical protein
LSTPCLRCGKRKLRSKPGRRPDRPHPVIRRAIQGTVMDSSSPVATRDMGRRRDSDV